MKEIFETLEVEITPNGYLIIRRLGRNGKPTGQAMAIFASEFEFLAKFLTIK